MEKKYKLGIFLLLFLISTAFVGWNYTYKHELVHRKICLDSGGKPDMHINYTLYPPQKIWINGTTECSIEEFQEMPDNVKLDIKNDIVGYHTKNIQNTILISTLLIAIVIFMR